MIPVVDHVEGYFEVLVNVISRTYKDIFDRHQAVLSLTGSGLLCLGTDIEAGDILYSFPGCEVLAVLRLLPNHDLHKNYEPVRRAFNVGRLRQLSPPYPVSPSHEIKFDFSTLQWLTVTANAETQFEEEIPRDMRVRHGRFQELPSQYSISMDSYSWSLLYRDKKMIREEE